jgi:predicted peptidase
MKRSFQLRKPSRLLLFIAFPVLLVSCQKGVADFEKAANSSRVNNNTPETSPAVLKAVTTSVTTNLPGYYEALPALYNSTTKKYPLLIFNHGIDALGNGTSDLRKVLRNGTPKLLSEKKFPPKFTVDGVDYSFVVLAPQYKRWPRTGRDINALIDYAIKNYRIDESRIYVAGLSMGGGATWEFAINFPARAAAVVPICGAFFPGGNRTQFAGIANAKLPVWAFHNADDFIVRPNTTTNPSIDYINGFKPAVAPRKTIWPRGGHDSWTRATNPATKDTDGRNIYEWMLSYKR